MTDGSAPGFRTLGELESVAARAVPPSVWAYVQGGAGEERALASNREAFRRRTLRPRVLVDVERLELSTTLLREPSAAPLFLCPTAYQGLLHPDGECATARAAAGAGLVGVFSTLSTRPLEEIAAAAPSGRRWFQLYVQPEFPATAQLVDRAERSGYSAIVLTVDTPVFGIRDRQAEGGSVEASAARGNGPGLQPPPRGPVRSAQGFSVPRGGTLTWETVRQLRSVTRLPVVLKGVATEEDARRAAGLGVRGLVVSNHGGRQLDAARPTLESLPEVVRGAGPDVEVYLDGGVRRGADIVVALALGAKAVGIGRPVLWALAAGGAPGVANLLDLLTTELANVLALTGRRSVREIDGSMLD